MATLIDKYFSQIDFDAIEAAVKKAESLTSGEMAVEMASHSRNWRSENLLQALVVTILSGIATLYLTRDNNWGVYYDFTQTALWGGVGFVVAYFGWGRFLRCQRRRQKVVWFRSLDRFAKLTPVRNLAGVLIFVSLEEDEAAIVADKGIASIVSPEYWQTLRAALVDAMKQGNHAEGIIQAIQTVGSELALHFPRDNDDINELPDKPTIVD
ncbi:MAG: TPM domain-containing protein [bacterium]